ncbi:hypothetical protein [Novipirellula rosea]|uniref:Uncharacterized protein n=1 Tax=Novipirellula rosea TaxID=1031540 RepID=A0ABP8NBG0_9BACT
MTAPIGFITRKGNSTILVYFGNELSTSFDSPFLNVYRVGKDTVDHVTVRYPDGILSKLHPVDLERRKAFEQRERERLADGAVFQMTNQIFVETTNFEIPEYGCWLWTVPVSEQMSWRTEVSAKLLVHSVGQIIEKWPKLYDLKYSDNTESPRSDSIFPAHIGMSVRKEIAEATAKRGFRTGDFIPCRTASGVFVLELSGSPELGSATQVLVHSPRKLNVPSGLTFSLAISETGLYPVATIVET